MKYSYQSKTNAELEGLADGILKKYPKRVNGFHVSIEGILEDMDILLLPRPGIRKSNCVDAFLPRDKDFMVIDEEYTTDLPYYRLVIAEEISHRTLEPLLWTQGVPKGANIYELDKQIYDDIEGDAYRMSLALLMPLGQFTERFRLHAAAAATKCTSNNDSDKINFCVNALTDDFEVTFNAVVSRGRLSGLFKGEVKRKELPGAVVF